MSRGKGSSSGVSAIGGSEDFLDSIGSRGLYRNECHGEIYQSLENDSRKQNLVDTVRRLGRSDDRIRGGSLAQYNRMGSEPEIQIVLLASNGYLVTKDSQEKAVGDIQKAYGKKELLLICRFPRNTRRYGERASVRFF